MCFRRAGPGGASMQAGGCWPDHWVQGSGRGVITSIPTIEWIHRPHAFLIQVPHTHTHTHAHTHQFSYLHTILNYTWKPSHRMRRSMMSVYTQPQSLLLSQSSLQNPFSLSLPQPQCEVNRTSFAIALLAYSHTVSTLSVYRYVFTHTL